MHGSINEVTGAYKVFDKAEAIWLVKMASCDQEFITIMNSGRKSLSIELATYKFSES